MYTSTYRILLHAPSYQEICNLRFVVALYNDMLGQTVDLNIFILLIQENPQFIPQR